MFFVFPSRHRIFKCVLLAMLLLIAAQLHADTIPGIKNDLLLMDMVHHNPGELPTQSKFLDPSYLKSMGYNAKVFFLFDAAQFGINWKIFDRDLFPDTSKAAKWVHTKSVTIQKKYIEAKRVGLKVYCMLDMLVLPTTLVTKYKNRICNNAGKIDISKPFTQECIKSLLNQMFDTFPQLDGLVIRTGETYLQDAPFYTGNHPVVNGMIDHITLINLLREEVCVKRNKEIFYRTWDMGKLHSLPQYYLQVTDSIVPHDKLYFCIKHTIVDYWRSAPQEQSIDYSKFDNYWITEATKYGIPFNPCIGMGKHKQIIEVQCQREYEGKGAHPNYIAGGVLYGFDEFKTVNSIKPYCLSQMQNNPLFAGVWTWSRGGGWNGPFIKNEFWCELNAYVISQWTLSPALKEDKILERFALQKGLPHNELKVFYRLCRLSTLGVMKGQYSTMGNVMVVWTRDNYLGGTNLLKNTFDSIIKFRKVKDYLQEKRESVDIWKTIEVLSGQLHFKDTLLNAFVRTSCTYGRLKYAIIEKGWSILLLADEGSKTGNMDKIHIKNYIKEYDALWKEWKNLFDTHDECSSLYKESNDNSDMSGSINQVRMLMSGLNK